MKRRVFSFAINAAAALSLLLCVALWPISFAAGPGLFLDTGSRNFSVTCWRGKITFAAWSTPSRGYFNLQFAGRTWAWDAYDNLFFGSDFRWSVAGFDVGRSAAFGTLLTIPFWFVALCLSVSVAWRMRFVRRRVASGGVCASCGYDLRATPQEGGALLERCPECGAVPTTEEGRVASAPSAPLQ